MGLPSSGFGCSQIPRGLADGVLPKSKAMKGRGENELTVQGLPGLEVKVEVSAPSLDRSFQS